MSDILNEDDRVATIPPHFLQPLSSYGENR